MEELLQRMPLKQKSRKSSGNLKQGFYYAQQLPMVYDVT